MVPLIEVHPDQISPQLRALFDPCGPASLRGIAVLEGIQSGTVYTDNPREPTWLIVYEKNFGTIYPGGEVGTAVLCEIIARLREQKMVLLGFWPGDPRWEIVPADFDYEGRVLDFYDRLKDGRLQKFVDLMPERTRLCSVDEKLITRSINRDMHLDSYPSSEAALSDLTGFFLMREDEILCEALAGAGVRRIREIGVDTYEHHRKRGYATITCAKLIQTCESRGYQTYWNCNKANIASTALARKLGYRIEKEYKLVAWNQK